MSLTSSTSSEVCSWWAECRAKRSEHVFPRVGKTGEGASKSPDENRIARAGRWCTDALEHLRLDRRAKETATL